MSLGVVILGLMIFLHINHGSYILILIVWGLHNSLLYQLVRRLLLYWSLTNQLPIVAGTTLLFYHRPLSECLLFSFFFFDFVWFLFFFLVKAMVYLGIHSNDVVSFLLIRSDRPLGLHHLLFLIRLIYCILISKTE
jgi:hypothetical protein